MSRLGLRVARVAAARPVPTPVPTIDPTRLTPAQQARAGEIRARIDAVGLGGLSDAELDDAIALSRLLTAPVEEAG